MSTNVEKPKKSLFTGKKETTSEKKPKPEKAVKGKKASAEKKQKAPKQKKSGKSSKLGRESTYWKLYRGIRPGRITDWIYTRHRGICISSARNRR